MNKTDEMFRNQRLDAVNRIKYEGYDEFEGSLFADVYEKASFLTSFIIEANQKEECDAAIDRSICGEEQYNNIISFWGERGMGKSSAMLSYALFLKKYNDKSVAERFRLVNCTQNQALFFYVMPRIDAAMLVQDENLIDNILAKMWSDFCEKINESMGHQSEWKETEKDFEAVKKSYETYRNATFGKYNHSMTSVRQLDELAKCLNLRNDFKKLVNEYLKYMADGHQNAFFVITIDDLDMVSGSVYAILEQIRLFLMVPKVIVLVTADYGRLFLEYNNFLSRSLICSDNIKEHEKRQIRGYAEKYLAKIFPSNMRIHMPRLNVTGGVPFKLNVSELGIAFPESFGEQVGDKRALFLMIAYYSGIMLYPFDNHFHILQKQSLRTIVNELYELKAISDMSEQSRFQATCSWLQTSLIEYGRTVEDEATYDHIQKFLMRETESADKVLAETLLACIEELAPEEAERYRQSGKWSDYGKIIMYLHFLEKQKYHDFIHFLLIWYSVQLREGASCAGSAELQCRDVFYSTLTEENHIRKNSQSRKFRQRSVGGRVYRQRIEYSDLIPDKVNTVHLEIVLAISKEQSVTEWVSENMDMICDAYKAANLGDWNLWYEEREDYLELQGEELDENNSVFSISDSGLGQEYYKKYEEGKDIIKIKIDEGKAGASNTSLEIVLNNALEHDARLEGFLKNVCRALLRLMGKEMNSRSIKKAVADIKKNRAFETRMGLEKFKQWKKEELYCENWRELLPLESMEIMLHLTNEICGLDTMNYENSLLRRVVDFQNQQWEKIIKELEKVEQYYKTVREGKYGYAVRLQKLKDIVRPYELGEKFIKMTYGGDRNEISNNTEI